MIVSHSRSNPVSGCGADALGRSRVPRIKPDYVMVRRVLEIRAASDSAIPGMQASVLENRISAPENRTHSARDGVGPTMFQERLRRIHHVLCQVNPLTLEEWEACFRREENPERALAYWSGVARLYEEAIRGAGNLPLEECRKRLHRIVAC